MNLMFNLCTNSSTLTIFLLIKYILKIICIIIPFFVLFNAISSLTKTIIKGENLKEPINNFIKSLISSFTIFILPTIISFTFTNLLTFNEYPIKKCFSDASISNIEKLKEKEKNNRDKQKEENRQALEEAQAKQKEENKKNEALKDEIEKNNKIANKVVNFAISIANDNSHGYSNVSGHQLGEDGQYNCIGLVIKSYQNAGINLYKNGIFDINSMYTKLIENGFVDITDKVNLDTGEGLEKGDVLWMLKGNGHGHTEIYAGNGKLVGARADLDGINGDSSGNEITISSYYNMPWQKVLRYKK